MTMEILEPFCGQEMSSPTERGPETLCAAERSSFPSRFLGALNPTFHGTRG
jgi:hypothetical protein